MMTDSDGISEPEDGSPNAGMRSLPDVSGWGSLPSGPSEIPQQVGPYKILEVLGEGGMGIVYLAEQTKPIYRRVALKIIKLGMDTKQVIARFKSERQALAMMDHPNVAKIFDAGVSGCEAMTWVTRCASARSTSCDSSAAVSAQKVGNVGILSHNGLRSATWSK